jgi:preprotein translocase subunit SecY
VKDLGTSGKYGDLKRRLLFLLGALVVFRIGAHIPVPGIDPNVLADMFRLVTEGVMPSTASDWISRRARKLRGKPVSLKSPSAE